LNGIPAGRTDVLGVDPGPRESAFALVSEGYVVLDAGTVGNDDLAALVRRTAPAAVAVESIQSYGMPVGRETFETCYAVGRALQACADLGTPCFLYPRPEYARRLCGVGKVSDAVLRQALLLRFGGDRKGEPLHRLKGSTDKRSAFAVAVYHRDLHLDFSLDLSPGLRPVSTVAFEGPRPVGAA
jgi:Holliday junction resolvasome RuvABC endonuclease subunit